MTPQELEEAMKKLGLSQGALARKMDVRPETVHRWLHGVAGKPRKIPGPVAVAVSMWLEQKEAEDSRTEDAL
jgi:plasmid maintenance system antidote protein VapI